MPHFFSTFDTVRRQQCRLFRAFARWQNNPSRELGDFGLSVTTEISNPRSNSVTIQFLLHHQHGGVHQSGVVTLNYEPEQYDLARWLPDATTPLLREFLLPSAIAGEFRHKPEPELVFDGGRMGA